MKRVALCISLWLASVTVIPLILAFGVMPDAAFYCFAAGFLASSVMFGILVQYINYLILRMPQGGGSLRQYWAEDCPDDDFPDLTKNREVLRLWKDRIGEIALQNLSDGELLPAYRRTLISLFDRADPYFSERIVSRPTSEILRIGSHSRKFSFPRFCRALGR